MLTLTNLESKQLFRVVIEAIQTHAQFPCRKTDIPNLEPVKQMLDPHLDGDNKTLERKKVIFNQLDVWVIEGWMTSYKDDEGATCFDITPNGVLTFESNTADNTPAQPINTDESATVYPPVDENSTVYPPVDNTAGMLDETRPNREIHLKNELDEDPTQPTRVMVMEEKSPEDTSHAPTSEDTYQPPANNENSQSSSTTTSDDDNYMPNVTAFLTSPSLDSQGVKRRRANFGIQHGTSPSSGNSKPTDEEDDAPPREYKPRPPVAEEILIDRPPITTPPLTNRVVTPPVVTQPEPKPVGDINIKRTGPRKKNPDDNHPQNPMGTSPSASISSTDQKPIGFKPPTEPKPTGFKPPTESKPPTNPVSNRATQYQTGNNPRAEIGWATQNNPTPNTPNTVNTNRRQPDDFHQRGPRNNPPIPHSPPPTPTMAKDGTYYYEEQQPDGRQIRLSKQIVDDWLQANPGYTLEDAIVALRKLHSS